MGTINFTLYTAIAVVLKEEDDFKPNDLEMLLTEPKDTGHLTIGVIVVVFGMVLSMHWAGTFTVDIFRPKFINQHFREDFNLVNTNTIE